MGLEGRAFMEGLVPLRKGTQRASLYLLTCEDIVERLLAMNQEVGSHQIPNILVPSQPPDW